MIIEWEKEFYRKHAEVYPAVIKSMSFGSSSIENNPKALSSLPIKGTEVCPIR